MKELVFDDYVLRIIKHKDLLQAVVKVAQYFELYPRSEYNTLLCYAAFDAGVYHIRMKREKFK